MPGTDEAQPVPTRVEDWGVASKTPSKVMELPSGHTARVKQTLNILRVVQEGQIPNPLRGIVMRMITTGSMEMPAESERDIALMRQFADFLDMVAVETMMEPPVDRPVPRGKLTDAQGRYTNPNETEDEYFARCDTWQPKEGHLSVFALDANDKMFLFIASQGAAADAKQFREIQEQSLDGVEAGKKSPVPTKRTGGSGKRSKK